MVVGFVLFCGCCNFRSLGSLGSVVFAGFGVGVVGFEFVSLLGDSLSAVPFALPVGFDFGASVAPFTVDVGPAGGAR